MTTMRVPPAQVFFPPEDRAVILEQIDECLRTGQLTLGKLGRELEERFAAYVGTDFAVTVNSGTSAIEIPLRALDVAGREVLVAANTFFATAAAALSAGASIRFLDCDPKTMAVEPDCLRAAITPQTAAVIVVHIGGLVTPHIAELRKICDDEGVFLLEDAAHAHGSAHDGQMAGTFGGAASFSFYPTKVMAGGEGGIIVTNDERIADEARIYRDQGKASFLTNLHTRLGYNWRMSEPHAAIALSQFGRLDEFIAHRQHVAHRYDAALSSLPLVPLSIADTSRCNYYKYIAFLPDGVDRAELKRVLREDHGVGLSGEVYDTPLHRQPVFERWADGELPGAEWLCERHICLPISAVMTDDDADYVIEALADALASA
jgi:dTDP-4-amino-4,6-dideoxygalactose transaminase